MNMVLRRLPHALWLFFVWIALWGNLSVANFVSGLLVVGAVVALFAHVGPLPAAPVRPAYVLRLLGWWAKNLVVSTVTVVRKVFRREPVSPAILAFPMQGVTDAVVTLVANIITTTPGTLTLDVRSDGRNAVLYVHMLDLEDEQAARADIEELQRLALLAFADRDATEHLLGAQ